MTNTNNALQFRETWDGLWSSEFGHWLLTRGVHIVVVIFVAIVATRVIRHLAGRILGDLVQLTVAANNDAVGTVEDVTLRVTKLRTSDGDMLTVPNGQIAKTPNLAKDWARAVVDIPVPASSDLNRVNDVFKDVSEQAMEDDTLPSLLLDQPALMGVSTFRDPAQKVVNKMTAAMTMSPSSTSSASRGRRRHSGLNRAGRCSQTFRRGPVGAHGRGPWRSQQPCRRI
ncbi:MAG TPA: mechanosensitive ion channel domain-containing protein [Mycobacterium sp.]|nr:mechanosensitive ion channel domain-containing protein [Mycobacterium sp.]